MSILTISDINTTVDHEPRIMDLRLAEALGFANIHAIRTLIGRHVEALKRFGQVSLTQEKPGPQGGRPGKTYLLNRKQALFITAKSDTERAADIAVEMVEVFDRYLASQVSSTVAETAFPIPDQHGLALMRVGSQTVTVDTRRYKIGPTERAVRLHFDGRITIGKVEYVDRHQNWYGARKAYTPPHKPGPNDDQTAKNVRSLIHVLGAVVKEAKAERPKVTRARRLSGGSPSFKALPATSADQHTRH